MSSFSHDKKWVEAKRAIGNMNWLEVISYYRSINGIHVFVYSVVDGDKRLIVDVIDDDTVLLVSKKGQLLLDNYDTVLNSKKIFKYSEKCEHRDFYLGSNKYTIITECRL